MATTVAGSTKYQIFISSTFEDLKAERDQVIKAILEMGHIPVGMEMFSAADDQQWEVIKRQIDQSDYYIVIVAHRYGSMDGDISFTEKEYDYAVQQRIPVLGFVIERSADWPTESKENNRDIVKRLEAFRSKVEGRLVSHWRTAEDIYGRSGIALMKAFSSTPREGWIRASVADFSQMTEEMTRLSRENGMLRRLVEEKATTSTEAHQAAVDQIIDTLRLNRRNIVFRDGIKWSEAVVLTLLTIFETLAPNLIDEAKDKDLSEALFINHSDNQTLPKYGGWGVPQNFVKYYLSDLVALDLVCPSKKRHTVQDTESYWMLTDFGREVHRNIRRNELIKGLALQDGLHLEVEDIDDLPFD